MAKNVVTPSPRSTEELTKLFQDYEKTPARIKEKDTTEAEPEQSSAPKRRDTFDGSKPLPSRRATSEPFAAADQEQLTTNLLSRKSSPQYGQSFTPAEQVEAESFVQQNLKQDLSNILEKDPTSPLNPATSKHWEAMIGRMAHDKGAMVDINALVQEVLRQSYMENTEDLHFFAQKVKFFNEVKKQIRDRLTEARDSLVQVAGQTAEDGGVITLPEAFENTGPINDDYIGYDNIPAKDTGIPGGGDAVDNPPVTDGSLSDLDITKLEQAINILTFEETESKKSGSNSVAADTKYGGSSSYDKFDDHKNALEISLLNELPTDADEREALIQYWKTNGLIVQMNCKDADGKNNQYYQNGNGDMSMDDYGWAGSLGAATFADMPSENTCSPDALTMNDNETLEEFIARAVDAQCDSFKSNVKGEEGNINISSLHYKAEVPTFDVTRKEYQVEEGSAEASQYLDQGLFIIGETIPDGTKFTPQILEEIVVIDNGTEIHELEKLYDGEESYNTFDNYAADYTQDILNSMPSDPAEIEAWEKYYQENGLLLEMNCRETDWTNHQYYQSGTKDSAYSGSNSSAGADKFVSDSISSGSAIKIGSAIKMKPGESLEEFFKRAISEQTHSFRKNVSQQEGDIRIQSIHFKTEMPDLTVKVVEHKATSNEEMVEFMDLGYQTSPLLGAGTGTGAGDVSSAEAGAIETKEELENYIQGLEEQLNSVGDDSQLANVDLQNHLQKQQQVLQMMSNISKVLHDTAQAIIRKIGG